MEKADSTPVDSSTPQDVKKVDTPAPAPKGEDDNKDTPITQNDSSGGEMVGTNNEESLEKKQEELQDRQPSNIKPPSDNEVDDQKLPSGIHSLEQEKETSVGPSNSDKSTNSVPAPQDVKKVEEDHNKDTPIIKNDSSGGEMVGSSNEESLEKKQEEHQGREASSTKHLSGNEVIETAAKDQKPESSGDIHSVEASSSNRSLVDDEKDMKITSQQENKSTNNTTSSSSSSVGPLHSDNSINAPASVPAPVMNDLSGDEKMVATTTNHTDEKKHAVQEDTQPSTAKHLSDNEVDDHKIEASSKIQLVDDAKNDMKITNQEENISADTTASSSGIQKEDQEKGNSVNNTTISSTASDVDIKGQEEEKEQSTNNNLENSVNTITGVPDIQNEKKEKGNSVNDTTTSSTATDSALRGQEEEHSTNNSSLSNSDNSINTLTHEPQKEEQEKGNPVNDTKGQEEDHTTKNSLSHSENTINTLTDKPDINKEEQKKDNSINDPTVKSTAKEGELLDSETRVKVNHQSSENMETKTQHIQEETKNVKHVHFAEDVKDKGDLKNNKEGITKDSSSEGIGDKKKEKALVVYGTQQQLPIMGPAKPSVLTKFAKLKSLYTSSNVFRRLSSKSNLQNDEKNKNNTQVNSNEKSQTPKNKDQEPIPIKGRVVLYTKLFSQDCKHARQFLKKKRLRYSEINIDVYPGRKLELERFTGSSDVPKVFFNQVLIGDLKEIIGLDESGKLDEKIEVLTSQGASPKGPLPPFSGEDDECSKGTVDELAVIVKKMKETVVVKDRFYKFRRVANCFTGSEAVDFLSEDQVLEREEAIEFARKLAKELFFRHVLEENTFEDGNQHFYRFLDQDPVIKQCQNIPRGIIQSKRQPLVDLSYRLRFLLYAILEAYISEDGKHVAYRTIHGSEEFGRFLRIVEELQRVDLNKTAKEERLAFFINLYNLMAIHAILVWGHPEGALDRRKLFNEFKYVIGGCAYSLSDIYNGILRANQRPPYTLKKPFSIYDKRFKVSLPYPEPLVHFALVSGNRSAPALRCYSPKEIDVELAEAANDFLKSGAFELNLESKTVSVSKILKWYSLDFGKKQVEVLKHAANYLEVEKTRNLLELVDSSQLKVVYQPYDWRLNS